MFTNMHKLKFLPHVSKKWNAPKVDQNLFNIWITYVLEEIQTSLDFV